jgi:hypothetical protein
MESSLVAFLLLPPHFFSFDCFVGVPYFDWNLKNGRMATFSAILS